MATRTTAILSREKFQPGHELENYTLLEPLSRGGQALVWSAWDKRHERVVAIKFFSATSDEPSASQEAFEREVQAISSLNHPSILPLYDIGTAGEFAYFAMRYMPSGSLGGLLKSGPVAPPAVLRLAAQLAAALEYIHTHKIVHRDLKPDNILLDSRERVYLSDFGLAKSIIETTKVLHTGHGTALYAPPEQHAKGRISLKSDIYSLGILLFELFTGKLPWDGEPALAIRQLDTGVGLPDPRETDPALPAALAEVLRRLTAADPEARPASAEDAFNMVAAAIMARGAATRDLTVAVLEDVLSEIPPHENAEALVAEDAQYLLQRGLATWKPDEEKFGLSVTEFRLVDAVYTQAERYEITLEERHYPLMLRGALTHGHHLDFWWKQLSNPLARLQVGEQTVANEGEAAAARALALMRDEPTPFLQLESRLSSLIDLATESEDPTLRGHALGLLSSWAESGWRPMAFSPEGDIRLAKLALSISLHATEAARLIGRAGSETAVQELLRAQQGIDAARVLPALMEVRAAAGSLPRSTSLSVRLRVTVELAQRQLLTDRAILLRAYIATALGSALGLGFHVYAAYRLPNFLNAQRILNAVGSGIPFGLLMGLGIFLTRLVVRRLRAVSLLSRLALGVSLGALVVYLSIVGFHNVYLDAPPRGWPIAMSSVLITLGFGISAGLARSRGLRALISSAMVGLGIGLSWQFALRSGLSPVLYYEPGQPLQTALLIAVTSLLIGSVAHTVELSNEQTDVGIDALFLEDIF